VSRVNIRIIGAKEAIEKLKTIPQGLQRKHMRIALNAAGGTLKQTAISLAPIRSGLMRQAMAVKVTQKKNGDWYVVVGAKRGMKRAIRVTRAGKTRARSKRATSNLRFIPHGLQTQFADPARYIHLAEKGTKPHVVSVRSRRVLYGNGEFWGRRVTIRAKPSGFMRKASWIAGPRASQRVITKLREAALSYAKK
jgi:HK97 gp10 family phage protein